MRRDNFTCRYCRSSDGELTVDHVTPVALGGDDRPENLVSCCKDCNSGKASSALDAALVADVSDDAIRWSEAMKSAAQVLSKQREDREDYIAAFLDAWPASRYLPAGFTETVGRFHDMGLPRDLMVEAANSAVMTPGVNNRTSYFAAICWRRIRAMSDLAAGILSDERAAHA